MPILGQSEKCHVAAQESVGHLPEVNGGYQLLQLAVNKPVNPPFNKPVLC